MPNHFLIYQAMIVLAWNVGTRIQDAFNGTVIKQVLSIFITASILRLLQGKPFFANPSPQPYQ
jgi:H+/gluconate symporter-like permease